MRENDDITVKLQRVLGVVLCVVALLASATTAFAQSASVAAVADRINRARLAGGLIPYAISPQLMSSAQAHANDLARTGKYGHTGSDGSTLSDRVARAGYGAYSWGRRVGEIYAVYHSIDSAMDFWMKSRPHRATILHPAYREMGIGIAVRDGLTIYVVDFGAQPNVLPMFINDGASQSPNSRVQLTLTDETVSDASGKAIQQVKQVQVSNESTFANASWQPYAAHIPWTLAAGQGSKTVYVRYRDDAGRTVTANDSITAGSAQAVIVPPAVLPSTATKPPTATLTRKPSPTATRTSTPTATATRTLIPTRRPSSTPTRTLTETRRPSLTASPTASATVAPPTATATTALPPESAISSQNLQANIQALMPSASATFAVDIAATVSRFPNQASPMPVSSGNWAANLPSMVVDVASEEADLNARREPTVAELVGGLAEPVGPFALGFVFVGVVFGTILSVRSLARSAGGSRRDRRE